MKLRPFFFVAILSGSLMAPTGCVVFTGNRHPVDFAPLLRDDMGLLVFVRGSHYGHALLPYHLFVDGNCAGAILSADHLSIQLPPGRHRLSVAYLRDRQPVWGEQELELQVQAGHEYYIEGAKPRADWFGGDIPRLKELDRADGQELVAASVRETTPAKAVERCLQGSRSELPPPW